MAILSKPCKPDNFESHNSLKLSFTNIGGLRSNFVDSEVFLESNSPEIKLSLNQTLLNSQPAFLFFTYINSVNYGYIVKTM